VTTTEQHDDLAATYASVVGARLRDLRRQKRLSLDGVAASSAGEFKPSVLGAYERGERAISVPRLQRLARLYDVPVEQLLPEAVSDAAESAPSGRAAPPERVRLDLAALRAATGELPSALYRFASKIQLDRGDFNGQVLTIRQSDLALIAALFGERPEALLRALDELGCLWSP
jgi:transcriptional regulator with XRE-family HTH domain